MKTITCQFLHFIIVCIIPPNQSLVEISQTRNHFIASTESMIRNITNELFIIMRPKVKDNLRLKQFKLVHNFFTSITLRDEDNLNELARMTNVYINDNITRHFITEINEVLNNDDENKEATENIYVTQYIDTFIRQLKYFTEKHGFNENDLGLNINSDILKHLAPNNNFTSANDTGEEDTILSDHEFWKTSEENYRRIFQGKRTRIKKFPFMASVQFFKKFQCGGSIIKSDLVITAASCLQLAWNNRLFRENPAFLSVQVGSDFYEGGGENIAVLEIYFHPQYTPKTLQNNLAIMRLIRRIKFKRKSKKVKKINFDRNAWALPFNTPGITVVGWGARQSNNVLGNLMTNRLAYAVLDVYPLQDCQDVYTKEYVTRKHFCAGFISKGGGACNRDVGGPGVFDDRLMGVISFGSVVCGEADSPTVFTKLGYYTDWIEEIMEQQVPNVYAKTTQRPERMTFKIESLNTPLQMIPIYTGSPHRWPKEIERTDKKIFEDSEEPESMEVNEIFDDFISTMFGSSENDTIEEYTETKKKPNLSVDKFSLRDINQKDMQSLFKILDERLHGVKDESDSKELPRTEVGPYKSKEEASDFDIEKQIKPPTFDSSSDETKQVKVSYSSFDSITPEGILDESRSLEEINQLSIEFNEHDMVTKPIMFEEDEDTQLDINQKESIEKVSSKFNIAREDNKTPNKNWENSKDRLPIANNDALYVEITTKKIKINKNIKNNPKPIKNHQIHEYESNIKNKNDKYISFGNEVTQTFTAVTKPMKYLPATQIILNNKNKIRYASEESIEDKISLIKDKSTSKITTTDKTIGRQIQNNYIDTIADKIDEAMVITDDKVEIDIMKLIQSLDIRKDWPES